MKYFLVSLLIFFSFPMIAQVKYLPEDIEIFERFLKYSHQGDQSMIYTARFFMETPYVGGTLEGDDEEQLRVNLRELDCVTFVENVVALHLMLQTELQTFAEFCRILQHIRYRNGVIDGYLSRLHYFSDWLDNNRRKEILTLPTIQGCSSFIPETFFMSTHCDAYPALKMHPEWCKQMIDFEKNINQLKFCYIPKEQINNCGKYLQTGDVVGITTQVKGLDVTHTGLVIEQNGRIYLLHASSEAKKVIVSDETLHDYLANRKNHSGILIGRIIL